MIFVAIWFWTTIFLFVLSTPYARKIKNKQWSSTIKQELSSSKGITSVFQFIKNFILSISISFIFYIALYLLSYSSLEDLIKKCNYTFIISILSLLLLYIQTKKKEFSIWNGIFISNGIFLVIISLRANTNNLIIQTNNHRSYCLVLSIFLGVAIFTGLYIFESGNKTKIKSSNLRLDLCNRTTNFNLENYSGVQLIELYEEKYFDYQKYYKKISKKIERIEFISLYNDEYFYNLIAKKMRKFWIINFIICIIYMLYSFDFKILTNLVCLFIFLFNVKYLKVKDKSYLHRLANDSFYGMYGYCIIFNYKKDYQVFVGNIQAAEISKYHKYVHSFLNIAALCRSVAFFDKINQEQKIKILTNNMYELCTYYDQSLEEKWTKFLPLWISAIFEYNVTGEISKNTKMVFLRVCKDKKKNHELYVFLYGIWGDMNRGLPNDIIKNFINRFMLEIKSKNIT